MASKKKAKKKEAIHIDIDDKTTQCIAEMIDDFDNMMLEYMTFLYCTAYLRGKEDGSAEAIKKIETKLGIEIDFGKN